MLFLYAVEPTGKASAETVQSVLASISLLVERSDHKLVVCRWGHEV